MAWGLARLTVEDVVEATERTKARLKGDACYFVVGNGQQSLCVGETVLGEIVDWPMPKVLRKSVTA